MNTDTPEIDQINDTEREIDMRRRITAWQNQTINDLARQRDEARGQRDRLAEVIEAAFVLIAAKGRPNTMLAYDGLRKALQSLTTNAKP